MNNKWIKVLNQWTWPWFDNKRSPISQKFFNWSDRNYEFFLKFLLQIHLSDFCKCTNKIPFESKCQHCAKILESEKVEWKEIYQILDVDSK